MCVCVVFFIFYNAATIIFQCSFILCYLSVIRVIALFITGPVIAALWQVVNIFNVSDCLSIVLNDSAG